MRSRQNGATLVVGLMLLSLVTLLSLAAAGSAHLERLLAQNDSFRENAASASGAGIEMAIRAIETSSAPASVPSRLTGRLPDASTWAVEIRLIGYETALPQEPPAHLAGAYFEILSTGVAARRSIDRQRAGVLWVVDTAVTAPPVDCEPLAPRRCHRAGELERLSWQRVPAR
jgi:Tfp pilus assembly protein PilX